MSQALEINFWPNFSNVFSSGISSGSLASIGAGQKGFTASTSDHQHQKVTENENHQNGNVDKFFDVHDFNWSTNDNAVNFASLTTATYADDLETTAGILEDPFDAEWAALAMRNTSSKNPFLNDKIRESDVGLKKAFELQMWTTRVSATNLSHKKFRFDRKKWRTCLVHRNWLELEIIKNYIFAISLLEILTFVRHRVRHISRKEE